MTAGQQALREGREVRIRRPLCGIPRPHRGEGTGASGP